MASSSRRHGWVSANAGIDESNLGRDDGALLLLPDDPDLSARRIAESITSATGVRPGVVITDTFGRPWRRGLVNVAIGLANLPAIVDLVGSADAYGRTLQVSQQAFADEIAAASGLLMLKEAAMPVVVVRGLRWTADRGVSARHYVRPLAEDLFK
jgi:coenzyme F420-0:L-glutamate ligase / coenzyme F420-1:gamma-L-glutamate ligase